jgi:carbon starvation protein CstA
MVMKAPVWALVQRTKVIGSSAGHHRFQLIDQTIERINEWWLLGTVSTSHWGRTLHDITNEYVSNAVRGGLITLILFVALIIYAFVGISRLMKIYRNNYNLTALTWTIGLSIFCFCTSFFGSNISAQNQMLWNMMLAMVGSLLSVKLYTGHPNQMKVAN